MGLDVKTLAAAKKYTKDTATGGGAIQGQPGKDAPTITSVNVDENNVLLTTLSDGTTLNGGTIKTVSGTNGTDGADGLNGTDGKDGKDGITPHIDSVTKHWFIGATDAGIVAEGKDGSDGAQGIKGEQGLQGNDGKQGIQGIQGERGADGYPFLIYKEYTSLDNFNASDFPEIGLMFMIKTEDATSFPVYRYTGEITSPYSFVTNLSGSEGIKGDKGDPGTPGQQGIPGQNGKDGTTYTPTIGTVTSVASTQNPTASITIDETEKTAKFNFGIPKGKDGSNGKDGTDGFTPTITENSSNKDDYYRLDVTNKNGSFTTPNLMGVIGVQYKNKSAGTPVGEIISYMGTSAPENYLICDDSIYQISDYPILSQYFADTFGNKNYFGGNGTTTFAVPDLRGEFLRGSGNNSHTNSLTQEKEGSGADVGVHQSASVVSPVGSSSENNVRYFSASGSVEMWEGIVNPDSTSAYYGSNTWIQTSASNTSQRRKYFTERPTNTSVLYCIKYQPTYFIDSNMKYKNISNQISIKNSNLSLQYAYVESNIVNISIQGKLNTGANNFADITNLIYAPRNEMFGLCYPSVEASDMGKITYIAIYNNGKMYAWVNSSLSNSVVIKFSYPLKIN